MTSALYPCFFLSAFQKFYSLPKISVFFVLFPGNYTYFYTLISSPTSGYKLSPALREAKNSSFFSKPFNNPAKSHKGSAWLTTKIISPLYFFSTSFKKDLNLAKISVQFSPPSDFFSSKIERFEKKPEGGENWTDIL